ncbi:MAG TPA: ABC transporter transmembrane domain-containing protein, partial [Amnibacterium sp.]|nr:ABC transporter transmembrane domain-containing protein [Amnibacterium sp.]
MSGRPSPMVVLRRIRGADRATLVLLGVARAVGLVLTADGLAQAIVTAGSGHLDAAGPLEAGVGVAVRAAAVWATIAVTAGAAAGVKDELRRTLLAALLPGRPRVGAMTALLTTGLDDLDAYYGTYLPALVAAATVPPLVGLRILVADPLSAGVLALTLPLVPLFLALIGLHTRDRVAAATDALARLSDHLVELARGLPVLVGLGRFEAQSAALRRISDEHRRRSLEVLRTAFLSSLALELLSTISVALVAVLVGLRLLAGDLTLEAGLVALVLAPECFAPIRDVGAAFHASRAGEEVELRIRQLLGAPVRTRFAVARELAVSHLTVRHPGRTEPAVRDLSFSAAPGSIVLLAGPSGAGKSTVLDVLAGRGAALDADARVSGAVRAPESVAYVPQQVRTVASDVLAELRAYGSADPLPALARLGIAGLAEADPAACSPGELRRIAVARAAVRVAGGARLVLLDEPTASLDPSAAQAVRHEIRRMAQGAVVVLVSHDPATMALADRVVPLGGSEAPTAGVASADVRPSATRVPDTEPDGSAARELAAVLRPAAGSFAGGAALGLLAIAASVALLGVSGWLIVSAAAHPPVLTLMVAMVGVRAFGIGRAVLRYAERLVTHSAVFRSVTALRLRLWGGIARRGPVSRALLRPGAALDRLVGDADRVRDLVPRTLAPLGTAVLAAAGATAALLLLDRAAGVVLGVAACTALLAAVVGTRLSAHAARSADALRSRAARAIADLLAAADDLAGNQVDGPVRESAAATARRADRAAVRSARLAGMGPAVAVLATGLAAVGALLVAAPAAAGGTLPVPVLAVLALLPLALAEPLADGASGAARLPQLTAVLRRVAAV